MSRESRIVDQMDLLNIKDVSTPRQCKNGTVVWRLPIKNKWNKGSFIEVASFTTGYVRNQNSGYSNYQLNKRCDSEPQYYKLSNGYYNKYITRSCVLIPKEIDRLEYLIAYCLKNYYIKNANEVANGDYIPKWTHEYDLRKQQEKMEEICHIDANHQFVINELQNKLANSVPKWKYDDQVKAIKEYEERVYNHDGVHYDRIKDLEVEVELLQEQLAATKVRQDVSVIVNGHRYKVL